MIPKQLKKKGVRFILLGKKSKVPLEENWQKENNYPKDDEKLKKHIKEGKNYGVVAGNGLIVMDADTEKFNNIIQEKFPKTFSVKTKNGTHYYYFCVGFNKKKVLNDKGNHLGEIQSNGSFVVGSGSTHPSGKKYNIKDDINVADIDKKVIDKVLKKFYSSKKIGKDIILKGAKEGLRNDSMFKLACSFREKDLEPEETLQTLKSINKKNDPSLSEGELKKIVESAYRYKEEKKEKKTKNTEKKKDSKEEETIRTSCYVDEDYIVEQVYNGDNRFCIYDVKKEKITYKKSFTIDDIKYKPMLGEEIRKKAIHLPTKAIDYENNKTLDKQLKKFIKKWLDIDDSFLQFAIWNIKRSWVYERFHTLNYLRALGDTGMGKSRFLDVLGLLHYKPIPTSGATTSAPIFRIIDKWKGTIIMDEADFKKSDESQDIIKIINQGYEKGKHIMRCDQNDASKMNFFDPFCPKVIATRKTFVDKAVESRCITQVMTGTDRDDIPFNLNDDFFEEIEKLRNKLLMWRFKNYHKIDIKEKIDFDLGDLEPRVQQIVNSFVHLFKENKKEMEKFKDFIQDYQEGLIDERKSSYDGQIVKGIYNLLKEGKKHISATDVANASGLTNRKGNTISARSVGHHLKSLGFKKPKIRKIDGKPKRCIPLHIGGHLKNLFKRYGYKVTKVTEYTMSPQPSKKLKKSNSAHRIQRNQRNVVTEKVEKKEKNEKDTPQHIVVGLLEDSKKPLPISEIHKKTDISEKKLEKMIKKLRSDGDVYEQKPGYYLA